MIGGLVNFVFNIYQQLFTFILNLRSKMKRRTLSGSCGIGIFFISFICVFIAFATPNWIVSDYRITGAKLDRVGLWTHCFRSLADPNDDYNRRFFVGCRWVFDPFTTGYDEIRGFLIPRRFPQFKLWFSLSNFETYCFPSVAFMIATQFFYTLCFIASLIGIGLVMFFFLCAGPDQKFFVKLIKVSGSAFCFYFS